MKLPKYFLPLLALGLVACGGNTAKTVAVKDAIQVTDQSKVKPIGITKVVAKIKRGEIIGTVNRGLACINYGEIKWRSRGKQNFTSEDLVDIFRGELEANGWPVVGTTEDLFQGYDLSGAEILVAAKITDFKVDICYQGIMGAKGKSSIAVDWQVYNPATKSLIGSVFTEGSFELDDLEDDAEYTLIDESFAVAVNNLLASKTFMGFVEKSEGLRATPSTANASKLPNKRVSFKTLEEAVAYAKKSTVTIRTATSHGSGFAIGDGSTIITNAHVVGEAQNVTVVTSSGLSIDGAVVKVSKERDIAQIQISGVRLSPLHVDTNEPNQASKVFAIGSPLDEGLSGTVTQGIVSSFRNMDGMQYLQSDTAISPGNSGGPLLNENGSVVAVSVAGMQAGGSQVGLNFFIPIENGLSFIGLKVE